MMRMGGSAVTSLGRSRGDSAESAPNRLTLLVDAAALLDDPELDHLLSFGGVEGLTIEPRITIVEPSGASPAAVLGAEGTRHMSIGPLQQFREFAAEIASRPGTDVPRDVIERALIFSFLAKRFPADAVVSPARRAFGPDDAGLLDIPMVVTVAEALALIGAYVRQREEVPLGGIPLLLSQRTEVYPLTATVITPAGEAWWSACVRARATNSPEWLDYAGAVFKRIGQALRGRDGVHETLRLGRGRAAILGALYHLDVVLLSSVGALDALARTAHELYDPRDVKGSSFDVRNVGWQKEGWVRGVAVAAGTVAAVVGRESRLGAALRVLTHTRNSIHGIPLDEYLFVQPGGHASRVEHRVGLSSELSDQLQKVGKPLGTLEAFGLHVGTAGTSFLNVSDFAESLLSWTIEISGALMEAMLTLAPLAGKGEPVPGRDLSSVEVWQRQACAALARVGRVPTSLRAAGHASVPIAPSASHGDHPCCPSEVMRRDGSPARLTVLFGPIQPFRTDLHNRGMG